MYTHCGGVGQGDTVGRGDTVGGGVPHTEIGGRQAGTLFTHGGGGKQGESVGPGVCGALVAGLPVGNGTGVRNGGSVAGTDGIPVAEGAVLPGEDVGSDAF